MKKLTKSILTTRAELARRVFTRHQPQHIAIFTSVILMTIAPEVGDQIGAVAAVVTWLRLALVDLVLAQFSLVAVQALTRVEADVVDAGRVVLALGLKTLVDVLRAIVLLIAELAVASVVLRWISAHSAVLAVLLEAQDATFFGLGGVQAVVRTWREIFPVEFRLGEERKQQTADSRFTDATFERCTVGVESFQDRVGLRLIHSAQRDRIIAREQILEGFHVDVTRDRRGDVLRLPTLPAGFKFALRHSQVQNIPIVVGRVVAREAMRLREIG